MAAVLVNNPHLLDPGVLLTLPPSPFKGPLLFPIENLVGFLKDLFIYACPGSSLLHTGFL